VHGHPFFYLSDSVSSQNLPSSKFCAIQHQDISYLGYETEALYIIVLIPFAAGLVTKHHNNVVVISNNKSL